MALIFLCPIRMCTEQNAGRCKVFDFYRSRVDFVLSFCKNVVVYFSITTSFYTDDVIGAQGWRGGAWGGSRGDGLNAPIQGNVHMSSRKRGRGQVFPVQSSLFGPIRDDTVTKCGRGFQARCFSVVKH